MYRVYDNPDTMRRECIDGRGRVIASISAALIATAHRDIRIAVRHVGRWVMPHWGYFSGRLLDVRR